MAIGPDSLITVQSVSPQAAFDKLAGTPMQPYAQLFIDLSRAYSIDLNWILSYLQWENGFGAANDIFSTHHNAWDLLCSCGSGNCSYPGCIGCRQASNGYCYYAFDNFENGIQAGYINWQRYVASGWNTWFTSLSVALCGNPSGCTSGWVNNVIAQGDLNSRQWPVGPADPLAVTTSADQLAVAVGQAVTFRATGSGGVPPYAFMWNFGDGVIVPGDPVVTHSYGAPGVYWAGAQIHDSAGDSLNSEAVQITVSEQGGIILAPSGIAALGLGLILVGGAYYVWKTWG